MSVVATSLLVKMKIKALYFGDSIMAYDNKPFTCVNDFNHPDITEVCAGYPTILSRELGVENLGNFAVGGNTIFDQLPKILAHDFEGANLVIITIGCNDFCVGLPIGKCDDECDDTFCGAYNKAINHIKSKTDAKIILMTPLHRNTLHRSPPNRVNCSDTVINGQTLYDFADAVKQIATKHNCFVVDMMVDSGLTLDNLKNYTFEGVHPTNKGYEFIKAPLITKIKQIFEN